MLWLLGLLGCVVVWLLVIWVSGLGRVVGFCCRLVVVRVVCLMVELVR